MAHNPMRKAYSDILQENAQVVLGIAAQLNGAESNLEAICPNDANVKGLVADLKAIRCSLAKAANKGLSVAMQMMSGSLPDPDAVDAPCGDPMHTILQGMAARVKEQMGDGQDSDEE